MAARPESTTARWLAAICAGADSGHHLSGRLTRWLAAALDPRARMLRKRRRALRWGLFFAVTCGFWILATALLASWPTPVWVLLITGLIAAGAAWPSTLLLLRYRWLRSAPLPARRVTVRELPPPGSAARPAMVSLRAAERGLYALLAVLERGRLLPAGEITGLAATAERGSVTMASTAAQIAAMEHAVRTVPGVQPQLASTISALVAQLEAGVRQYSGMLAALAQLVESTGTDSTPRWGTAAARGGALRDELEDATDRLACWAEAFEELGALGHPAPV